METRKSPLPLLLDKHQRSAKLPLYAVAAISSILDLTAYQDGCIVVHTHLDLVQAERCVLQVSRLMSREPLLLCQHESERPYADEIVCKCALKESGITMQFGGGSGVSKTHYLLFNMFLVHCVTPFCYSARVDV